MLPRNSRCSLSNIGHFLQIVSGCQNSQTQTSKRLGSAQKQAPDQDSPHFSNDKLKHRNGSEWNHPQAHFTGIISTNSNCIDPAEYSILQALNIWNPCFDSFSTQQKKIPNHQMHDGLINFLIWWFEGINWPAQAYIPHNIKTWLCFSMYLLLMFEI